jgi:hypothetical protein
MSKYLEKFGPTDLFNLIKKFNFTFELSHYQRIFLADKSTVDLVRSPIITPIERPITTGDQINFIIGLSQRGMNIRELTIETGANASLQCNYLYNRLGKPNKPTNCWLCGYRLNIPGDSRSNEECEHIIPAAAALAFHGIIDDTSSVNPKAAPGGVVEDEGDVQFYALNYDLAHSQCNSPKKDALLFITLFNSDYTIVDTPQINEPLLDKFVNSLFQPVGGTNSLVYDLFLQECSGNITQELAVQKKSDIKKNIIKRLNPLVENLAGIRLYSILGINKLIENIDFIFAKYYQDGIEFPISIRDDEGKITWKSSKVKTKKNYIDFIDLANTKVINDQLALKHPPIRSGSHPVVIQPTEASKLYKEPEEFHPSAHGGKRKRTRRIKRNGKHSTNRRRLRSKNGGRKNSRSHRKA